MHPRRPPAGAGEGLAGGQARRGPGSGCSPRTVTVAVLAVVALLLVPTAAAQDTSPPEFESVSKVNDTTVRAVFTDETNVSVASINRTDFALSAGEINRIETGREGNRTVVTIHLKEEIPDYLLHVALRRNATIADGVGNVLNGSDAQRHTIEGMDGIAPGYAGFSARRTTSNDIEVLVKPREKLDGMNVTIQGPVDTVINGSAFEQVDTLIYRARFVPPTDGTYFVGLRNLTDRAGNTGTFSASRVLQVDKTPPAVDPSLDLANSAGLTFSFTGEATDDHAIESYRWVFGDGSSETGRNVTHTYDEPGRYRVRLAVTDEFNNTGTATLGLTVPPGGVGGGDTQTVTTGNVTVRRSNPVSPPSAIVSADGVAANTSIQLGTAAGGNPLVVGETFALRGLDLRVGSDGPLHLAIEASDASAIDGFAAATGAAPLGTISVIQASSPDRLAEVDFALRVDADRLDAVDANASAVRLYRRSDGTWTTLQTTMTGSTGNAFRYRAVSPGFSTFVLGAAGAGADGDDPTANGTPPTPTPTATPTPTPTPTATNETAGGNGTDAGNATTTPTPTPTPTPTGKFVVANASLNTTQVAPGGAVTVNVTVRNEGDSLGTYTAGVTLNGTVVKTSPFVNVPPGEVQHSRLYVEIGNGTGSFPVEVNGTDAGTLQVGSGVTGGLLGSVVGIFGFLPWGILQPLAIYLGIPLVLIYLVLKALAIYLGY